MNTFENMNGALHDRFDKLLAVVDASANRLEMSPIERRFIAVFYVVAILRNVVTLYGKGDLNPETMRKEVLYVTPQKEIRKYRLDFEMAMLVGAEMHKLAVECDGHEFHERTKDQAARDRLRDRDLQRDGYTVFRFTGSEIFKDPIVCADECLDWVMAKIAGPAK